MSGRLTTFWLVLAITAVAGLYALKLEVQALEGELRALNTRIIAGQDAIRVLRAEWSYLNRPARLQQLAEAYLDLQPLSTGQIIKVAQVPTRPSGNDPPADTIAQTPPAGAASVTLVRLEDKE